MPTTHYKACIFCSYSRLLAFCPTLCRASTSPLRSNKDLVQEIQRT